MDEWIDVGPVGRFRADRGRVIEVGATKLAVFRSGKRFAAIQDACPHMGASLAGGRLVGDRVVCHWHGWSFSLIDGVSDMREWACAAIHPTRVERGRLFVRRSPIEAPERPAGRDEPDDEPLIRFDPGEHFRSDGDG